MSTPRDIETAREIAEHYNYGAYPATKEWLAERIAAALARQREEDAGIADSFADSPDDHEAGTAVNIAAAIRALGTESE